MNSRPVLLILALGFGIVIVLIAVSGFGAIGRADGIYMDMKAAQDAYSETESFRRGIATDIYLADILLRDYLLDPSPESAPKHRQELLVIRNSLQQRLDQLSARMPDTESPGLARLREEVGAYWDSLDPIFDWTPEEKARRSWIFLARRVLPRREAVVSLVRELATINTLNLERERERVSKSQEVLHRFLLRIMAVALGIGIFVAVLTMYRVFALERKHDIQHRQLEETQNNLRRLSQRLVQAQELERAALSRELHDEVGQMMTALGMELKNLESLRHSAGDAFDRRMSDARRLNTDAMRAIRDLAMGLRPSMLDDIGLEAALQWQGREFSRHTGVNAKVIVEGTLDDLGDAQQTCIYRVVQEALTNCARHAKAKSVGVSVRTEDDNIIVVVQDDGIGFNSAASLKGGLGLLGLRERVETLDGRLLISSQPQKGTILQVEIPIGVRA
jgi:signal transduction histidine kinase